MIDKQARIKILNFIRPDWKYSIFTQSGNIWIKRINSRGVQEFLRTGRGLKVNKDLQKEWSKFVNTKKTS